MFSECLRHTHHDLHETFLRRRVPAGQPGAQGSVTAHGIFRDDGDMGDLSCLCSLGRASTSSSVQADVGLPTVPTAHPPTFSPLLPTLGSRQERKEPAWHRGKSTEAGSRRFCFARGRRNNQEQCIFFLRCSRRALAACFPCFLLSLKFAGSKLLHGP